MATPPTNTASDVCIMPGFAPRERPMSRKPGRYRSIAIASKAVMTPRTTISGSVRVRCPSEFMQSSWQVKRPGFHGAHRRGNQTDQSKKGYATDQSEKQGATFDAEKRN